MNKLILAKKPLLLTLGVVLLLSGGDLSAQHHAASDRPVSAESNLGRIEFPTSGPAEAQKHFTRGVLLLHSFEYASARAAFAEAIRLAPDFAMAYWGEAMTYDHRIWGEQDRKSALASLARLGPTPAERRAKAPTEREKMYMDAVDQLYGDGDQYQVARAYSEAMAALTEKFPDDLEARALYSLSILGLNGTTRNTENYMRAAAIAEEIFAVNRNHPGALHYLIHAYDDPVHAPLGLRAARLYGSVAKGASHAQHMPSHIFFALGMWNDAIAANTDSMKTARAAGQGGYHPLHWLEHALLQVSRDSEAARLVAIVEDDLKKNNSRYTRSHLAMVRATYLVESNEKKPDSMLEPVDATGFASQLEFSGHDLAIGLEFVGRNDLPKAREVLTRLRGRIESDRAALPKVSAVADRYDGVSQSQIDIAQVMELVLDSAIGFASGDKDNAIRKAVAAGEAEDKLIFEYGPPMTVKPAWEAAGEIYLKLGRSKEAADAFARLLKRYPNRRLSNEGLRAARSMATR
jgi:tetratricopeptide (TPR) repeat protein